MAEEVDVKPVKLVEVRPDLMVHAVGMLTVKFFCHILTFCTFICSM